MKYLLPIFSAALVSLLVFGVPGDTPKAEADSIQAFGTNHRLVWDCVTEDVAGGPETIKSYKIVAFDPTLTPATPLMEVSGPGEQCFAAASQFLGGLPNGTVIRFAVKAIDMADNESAWSDTLDLRVDTVPPKPPSRPGCALFK